MIPKVSIIVPVYHVEKYLNRCVESLVNQTLKDIEIILVDDKSPDKSPQMCDEWAKKDPRIKVIHKEQNEGLGMACNTGLDFVSGEYVAFCDSDDWVDEDMYETMLRSAKENQADMVFSGLRRVNSNGKPIGFLAHRQTEEIYQGRNQINVLACDMIASAPKVHIERTIQMSAKVVLYSIDVIEKNKIRFVSERDVMSEDLHFNLSVLAHSDQVIVLPDFFYNYRCNPDSITGVVNMKKFEKIKILYSYTLTECEMFGLGEEGIRRTQRMVIGYVRNFIRHLIKSECTSNQKHEVIKEIAKDKLIKELWNNYPTYEMPLIHRLFFWALYHQQQLLISLMCKIK